MIEIRPSEERGPADHGWLKSKHTFSFADYHNPEMMGFAKLRVVNEDWIEPGTGFGTHPHRDMEIVTYVLDGALEHQDSLGNGSVLRHGDVQRMSAGPGVQHSEFNPSDDEECHLLQIWLLPDRSGHEPTWDEKEFPPAERRDRLCLLASPDGAQGSLPWRQDARLYASTLASVRALDHRLDPERHAWVQVTRGRLDVSGTTLNAGDGAAISDETNLKLEAREDCDFLFFDLP